MKIFEKWVRPGIAELKPYRSARDEFGGSAAVLLDANENSLGDGLGRGLNRYPDPRQRELKKALAKIKGIPPEQIFLGNGSDEAIDLLLRIFAEPGKERVILTPPTYGMYEVCAAVNGLECLKIQLDSRFQPRVKEILAAADQRTKLLFLCSPNNPTGNCMERERVRDLLNGFNGIVVLDEAYIDFSPEKSWLPELGRHPNLVILQTLSKAWGLAGLRVGMAFAAPEIIFFLNKIKFPYNLNSISQKLALQALRKNTAEKAVKQLILNRQTLIEKLRGLKLVEEVFPSDANFLLVRFRNVTAVFAHLLKRGIIVRDRSGQPGCAGCLRVTVGSAPENELLIQVLKEMEEK
ncbi:MAG: histidinol-phosphate transaminase [Calditrichia bacterium]